MAKDVKKTQKKNSVKEDVKKQSTKIVNKKDNKGQGKNASKNKKIVEKAVETKKDFKKPIEVKKEIKKEEKKITKNSGKKFDVILEKIENNRITILWAIIGFLVATLLFRCILWPDRIATLADGTQPVAKINGESITADDLYSSMKEVYSVNVFLNDIDDMILSELYPKTDDMVEEVNSTAEYYYNIHESYNGYTKEEVLNYYGFSSENQFIESLMLDYRRNKYYEEYAKSLVTDKEIDSYYKDDVFGDVDSKHILVKIDKNSEDGLTDEEAKKLANEIISKLNDGITWDEVIEKYKDKIVNEELGYKAFNASLESNYLEECKKLAVGSYSTTPVLTSYGYHIVYKIDQKDKPSLDDVKDDIIEAIATEKKNNDSNLYYKSLIKMREDAKLEFYDTKLEEEYKKFVNSYK